MKYSNKQAAKMAGTIALNNLVNFVPLEQLTIIRDLFDGEEGSYFIDKMVALDELINKMPETYGQDGKGDDAIAYLHYFRGGMDFYITEKDMENPQIQAFGLVNMGRGASLGYVSIVEILENNIEIDLYFEPTKIGELK